MVQTIQRFPNRQKQVYNSYKEKPFFGESMRIGFLGGSFNPVHFGHITIARQAFKEFSLDKVQLIVASEPPHKEIAFHVSGKKRYEMLKCGLADEIGIEASDIELKREGKSYTYDTVQLLKQIYPGAELYCIVGADMLYDLPTWFKARELLQEVGFIGFARGGEARDVSLAARELAAVRCKSASIYNKRTGAFLYRYTRARLCCKKRKGYAARRRGAVSLRKRALSA
jgi:nicotinate-nucleotide adenylyltransferase